MANPNAEGSFLHDCFFCCLEAQDLREQSMVTVSLGPCSWDTWLQCVLFLFLSQCTEAGIFVRAGRFLNILASSSNEQFSGLCLILSVSTFHISPVSLLGADLLFTQRCLDFVLKHSYVTVPSLSPMVVLRMKLRLFPSLALQMK